jgi:hypothetical protein
MADGGPSIAAEVSQLFRTRRVSEIRAIEASVRADAEDRASNLRTLLATRYPDLLAAADAVGGARGAASERVHDALSGLARDANALRAHFLARAKGPGAGGQAVGTGSEADYELEKRRATSAVGERLLHIVDSPEVLYACLESGRVFDATVRFAASEKAHAELDKMVAPAFACRRWIQVDAFRTQIIAAATACVQAPPVDTSNSGADAEHSEEDGLAGVIVSLIVLSPGNDVLAALDTLLSARTACIQKILSPPTSPLPSSATGRMYQLASVVRETVISTSRLFLGDSPTVMSLLGPIDSAASAAVAALSWNGSIIARLSAWLNSAREAIAAYAPAVIDGAASVRSLADTLASVRSLLDQSAEWVAACTGPLAIDPADGLAMFRPVICDRARVVVASCIRAAVSDALSSISTAIDTITTSTDMGDTLWTSVATHAVTWKPVTNVDGSRISATLDLAATPHAEAKRDDLSRERVRTGPTASVVRNLERALGDALADADILTSDIPEVAESLRAAVCESLPLIALCLRDKASALADSASAAVLAPTLVEMNGIVRAETGSMFTGSEGACIEQALFAARTSVALTVADHIPAAFAFGLSKDDSSGTENLTAFCRTAGEASSRAFQAWAVRLCSHFGAQLRRELTDVFALEIRHIGNQGRALGGDDATRAGAGQDSSMCPTAPSSGAVRFVLGACQAVNRAGGLALPLHAVEALNIAMCGSAVAAYVEAQAAYDSKREEQAAKDKKNGGRCGTERPENVYLQLLFDIRFLYALLLGRSAVNVNGVNTEKSGAKVTSATNTKFAAICASLTSRIDPINLASSSKMLTEAVGSFVGRSTVLLGTLTLPTASNAFDTRKPLASSSGGLASASVTFIVPPVQRFSYLPAPMPSTYTARSGLTAGIGAKAAVELLRNEAAVTGTQSRRRDAESTVVDYASKLTENVGKFGRGFLDSFRGVG